MAEADAVIAGEVGRCFRGRDDVVGGDAPVGMGQLNIHQLRALSLKFLQCGVNRLCDHGIQIGAEILPGDADPQAGDGITQLASEIGNLDIC